MTLNFLPHRPFHERRLNLPGTFSGKIINREFIGKTSDELIAQWNEEHTDDPVAVVD